jgi:hypothetical protein
MYHSSLEKGTEGTSGVPTLFQYLTQHVTQSQSSYFLHWDQLISLESNLTEQNPLSSLWVSDQESNELSFVVTSISNSTSVDLGNINTAGFTFVTFSTLNFMTTDLRDLQSFHRGDVVHLTSMKRSQRGSLARSGDSLVDIEDFQNISNMDPFIASGTVLSISSNEYLLSFKQMTSRFKRSVIFGGLSLLTFCNRMLSRSLGEYQTSTNNIRSPSNVFKFQPDDYNGLSSSSILRLVFSFSHITLISHSCCRSNVMRLLLQSHDPALFKETLKSNPNALFATNNSSSCPRLRDLVIDLAPPVFHSLAVNGVQGDGEEEKGEEMSLTPLCFSPLVPSAQHSQLRQELSRFQNIQNSCFTISQFEFYSGCLPKELSQEYSLMNSGQQQAVRRALSAQDYVLLLGMPGSGKTSTISFLIRLFISRGQRVLITSYTHSAVDNILEKLKQKGVPCEIVGRLGSRSSVRESVHEYLFDSSSQSSLADVQTYQTTLQRFQVIVCTVLTASRSILLQTLPLFDWSIVDECGQISQPAVLGVLIRTHKFLLVGDEYQLPPIILSMEAQSKVSSSQIFPPPLPHNNTKGNERQFVQKTCRSSS